MRQRTRKGEAKKAEESQVIGGRGCGAKDLLTSSQKRWDFLERVATVKKGR